MLFKDVIGQENVKLSLRETVQRGRISHAQLFEGEEGSGNLALAMAYAQYLLCNSRTPQDACGVCGDCHKIQKMNHPDLHFVFPVNSTKKAEKNPISSTFFENFREVVLNNPYVTEYQWYQALEIENKQGNISKYEADDIIRKMSTKAFSAQYAVLILWLPERMNVQASNMLLKLVEEPPENKIFLFVTRNSNQIITTIKSRTQRIRVPRISDEDLAQALCTKFNFTREKVSEFVHVAQGSYSRALEFIEMDEDKHEQFDRFRELMRLAVQPRVEAKIEILKWAERIAKFNREQQKSFCINAQRLLRENLMIHEGLQDITYLSGEELEFSKKFSPYIHQKNVPVLYKLFNDAYRHILQNGNGQLIFTDLVLKIGKLITKEG